MLKMRRDFPIPGYNRPSVPQHINRMCAKINHGLYGKNHTRHNLGCPLNPGIIWYFRSLMELATNAMTYKLPDNRKAVLFHMFLHSFGYIVYAIPGNCLVNPSIKCRPRHFQQGKPFRSNLPDRNAYRGIAVIALIFNAKIYTDYVAIPNNNLLGWNPVHHLFIDGNTQTARETAISFKGWFGATITTI